MAKKLAKVRYSDKRVGGHTGRVRKVIERDEHGNPTKWRVYPPRHWSDTHRERWLPLGEASLWHNLRDWAIIATANVADEKEIEGDGNVEEGLVAYIGRKRGHFGQKVGRFPTRQWAAVGEHKERWLPIEEAELWNRHRDWRIERKRRMGTAEIAADVQMAAPATPARHISEIVERLQEEKVAAPQFCLSENGVVHKVGCPSWPKYPLEEFVEFGEAINHENYKRVHRACCGEELEKPKEEVEAAVEQMNALGESLGIQATEV